MMIFRDRDAVSLGYLTLDDSISRASSGSTKYTLSFIRSIPHPFLTTSC